jgi:AcrR family transcriptional regulator
VDAAPTEIASTGGGTVRDRLIRAADAEVTERGIDGVQMEAVAHRAGVSRATAFRQLGSISEMLIQVALLRSRRYVAAAETVMATKKGVFAKLEAALLYTTHQLPTDPSVTAFIAQRAASVHHPMIHQMAIKAMGTVIRDGQASGEVRTDVTLDELVDFMVEQTYLAADEIDRSDAAVHRRFRNFIVPALSTSRESAGAHLTLASEAEDAVTAAIDALTDLAAHLQCNRKRQEHR